MRGYRIRFLLMPLLLAAGLAACASNGVQPGIVYTSSAPSAASGPGYPANGPVQANAPAQGSNPYPAPGVAGEAGRVVSIREVGLAGGCGGRGQGGETPPPRRPRRGGARRPRGGPPLPPLWRGDVCVAGVPGGAGPSLHP